MAISAPSISRALTKAGFTRSAKVAGGRSGVLSPITDGFKVWGRGSRVEVDYLPSDAPDRAAQLDRIHQTLASLGYMVAVASPRGDLNVTEQG